MTELPDGFAAHVANVGVKDHTDDFVVITADRPVPAAGVFTRSRFVGPSVEISRSHLADRRARAIVIVSKNANVANGPTGTDDATELVDGVAGRLGCEPADVLVASTGVIGRRYPMDRIRAGIRAIPAAPHGRSADDAAAGIMTTDTVPKVAETTVAGSNARVVGIAKGVGMIEPDMATMIAVVCTDADVSPDELDTTFRAAVDRTFNCVSIDTDTSTSDTAVVLASGAAGPVDAHAFATALEQVCLDLTKMIALDGEGAETLIEVIVDGARDHRQAKRVAKSIVNSPLVKTAVHGADPNWGRVAMAVGKCSDDLDIDQDRVVIAFCGTEVYPTPVDDAALAALSDEMRSDVVPIHVSLGIGSGAATVYGCDLTDGYVRINADYTT
ncbi:MAG: bifunctional glutamate N-acetyltransferase/amino-acid acetyltransferase ArgJ [Ilumatobacter sp.]|uniref:bifunctional glutamate N-acetyltransferase/amino-acid acetyltransferase ArgJ n=1 Tax=Ilumatobacter sp. TaxID=1967498 RepID=UPI0026022D56|nr:bifunctional glutamate N-acetyltransferase/amino-acid acetyltransferase ArgJ [Ilumatobacter sp.]MDJ0770808.1 bifunctional glutamate N-acetyltransferase/amino-acid acetyltransferase ArgJ [Ilumatobacter sp.]